MPPGPVLTREGQSTPSLAKSRGPALKKVRELAPLAPATSPASLAREVASLPPRDLLVSQGNYRVLLAPSWRIPLVLNEIGRERERSFRLVGEGSGLPRDLDRHDRTYLHLVLWDAEKSAVAGAYRLGRTDVLLRRLGLDGLYTHSLFRYQPEFFEKTGPALELGRSFVAPEYQRKPQPLNLLWRGLGEFVLRHPRYRRFIGPVSMSADYQPAARALVTAALASRWADPELSSLVSPIHPSRTRKLPSGLAGLLANCLRDESDLSTLVAAIQPDNSGLPILLKHYLRLNAKAVACNIDNSFGNCLDALIVVDLLSAEEKMLVRYLGEEGAATFRAYHAALEGKSAATTPAPVL
jgi:putative hemolysin